MSMEFLIFSGRVACRFKALCQAIDEHVFGQVLADENDLAAARFVSRPRRTEIAAHGLMYPLENHFARCALQPQHAFVAQHARSVDLNQAANEFLE